MENVTKNVTKNLWLFSCPADVISSSGIFLLLSFLLLLSAEFLISLNVLRIKEVAEGNLGEAFYPLLGDVLLEDSCLPLNHFLNTSAFSILPSFRYA